jgi:hypothetical protein
LSIEADILTVIRDYPVGSFVDGGSLASNDKTNNAIIEEGN